MGAWLGANGEAIYGTKPWKTSRQWSSGKVPRFEEKEFMGEYDLRKLVDSPAAMGQPDLVVLPGSKSTVADLEWLRGRGLDRALAATVAGGATLLGVCGGYQMLGTAIEDEVESKRGSVPGLGLLPVLTRFQPDKLLRHAHGTLHAPVAGPPAASGLIRGATGNQEKRDLGTVLADVRSA